MRITGGRARGIGLQAPPGDRTRPATDKLRLALFSSLGPWVEGRRFLDLFAGTGAYGLEAWSRGSAGGTFIEHHRGTARLLEQNVAAVARSAGTDPAAVQVCLADVFRLPLDPPGGEPAGLVFADPPYDRIGGWSPDLFGRFERWLAPGGRVLFEVPATVVLAAPGWTVRHRIDAGGGLPTVCILARSSDLESRLTG